ncbi:MAG: nucleotidyltransferase domain-containing protein [Herpetosiphonaceae bacterium]|nr:nucleotidyltransferase domain-containing protein [Herpetosiphonaceae bacterium]
MCQAALVDVPLTRHRDRILQATIDATVDQIARRFQPDQIILFGSYAAGTEQPLSDLDLLVIMDTPISESLQALQIAQALQVHFGLDLVVRTPTNLARRLALGDWFLHEVVTSGKVVYERTH